MVEGAESRARSDADRKGALALAWAAASLLSCEARSVYLCKFWMARRGLGGRPADGPVVEGKEEQPFQKLSVVASSGPGQQAVRVP